MIEYHKINTIFKRDPETKFKTLLMGDFSIPEFEYLANNDWIFTEKVDGTNIRIMFSIDGGIEFRGRTDRASLPGPLLKRLEEIFLKQFGTFISKFPRGVCLYGEGYGAKIQKCGENYGQYQDFVLFDVKIGEFWLQRKDVEGIGHMFGLDVVPVIGTGTLFDAIRKTQKGFNSRWGDFFAEGIVARPSTELKTRSGERIITKIKHRDFINK